MIVRLDTPAAQSVALAGGKGSALAQLTARGYPVPPGFVITTQAFADFCQTHGILSRVDRICTMSKNQGQEWFQTAIDTLQTDIRSLPLPTGLHQVLAAELSTYPGQTLWAVRSSAAAEDSKGASFAGQYDTVLGVEGLAEVTAAVLRCWASFFNANALAYKTARTISDNRMALVIQQLVDAEVAGVCFSVNPVTGDDQTMVVNANYGLGESVVGGLATPDTILMDKRSGAVRSHSVGSKQLKTVRAAGGSREVETTAQEQARLCLDDDPLQQLAALVSQVERSEGYPVDVEWAMARGTLYLLQARPVTASAVPTAPTGEGPPPGWIPSTNTSIDPRFPLHTNGNISEILPGCISPLTWSRVSPLIDYAFTQQYYQLGVIDKKPDPETKLESLAFFYYRPYICISYFTETAKAAPGLTPDIYLEEFVGKPQVQTPPFRRGDLHPRQIAKFLRMAYGFLAHLIGIGTHIKASHRYLDALTAELSDTRIEQTDTQDLIAKVGFSESSGYLSLVHIWVSSFASAGFAAIRSLTASWLDDKAGTLAAGLVTGIGVLPSAEPAFGLYALAERVQGSDVLRTVFAEADNHRAYAALRDHASPEAATLRAALDEFLQRHGHRGICEAELMTSCWRDEPAQVIGMIRNYLLPGVTPPALIKQRQEETRIAATRDTLRRLPPWRRLPLTWLLRLTKHFIYKREELKNLITLREDRARRVFQCLATRLHAQGKLGSPADIYFLTWREVHDLIGGTRSAEASQHLIALRRQEFEWCRQLIMPKLVDGKAEPMDLEDLSGLTHLHGTGVYPGRVEGRARVIMDPRVNATIEPGEILVAPVTDAGWTPLFINAAGLVVEVGGLLSHGSVVAREYGLPAVVGAAGATRRIHTGDRIVVDGVAGVVALLESA